jgi:hypothetical protein
MSDAIQRYDLLRLREEADAACDAAYLAREEFSYQCVNWGDFGCVSAEHWVDDEGVEGYRVLLEEADPNNREVAEFVRARLDAAGFHDVEITFEW